jgi:hypothetical protein
LVIAGEDAADTAAFPDADRGLPVRRQGHDETRPDADHAFRSVQIKETDVRVADIHLMPTAPPAQRADGGGLQVDHGTHANRHKRDVTAGRVIEIVQIKNAIAFGPGIDRPRRPVSFRKVQIDGPVNGRIVLIPARVLQPARLGPASRPVNLGKIAVPVEKDRNGVWRGHGYPSRKRSKTIRTHRAVLGATACDPIPC